MFSKNSMEKLDFLQKEGQQLLKFESINDDEWFEIKLWYSHLKSTLEDILPEDSELLAKFHEIQSPDKFLREERLDSENPPGVPPERDSDPGKMERHQEYIKRLVRKANLIIEYTRFTIDPPAQAKTAKEQAEEHERYIQEVEREVRVRISEGYFRSWWFRIPALILTITIVFAVVGVIQIRDFKISVKEISDQAVEQAKQEINAKVETILGDLQTYTNDEKGTIATAVAAHIEQLKQEKAPDAYKTLAEITVNTETLTTKVTDAEKKLESIENRLGPLERAAQQIGPSGQGELLVSALAMQDTQSRMLLIALLASLIALILSIISLWRPTRRHSAAARQA